MKSRKVIILALLTALSLSVLSGCNSKAPLSYNNMEYFGAPLTATLFTEKETFDKFSLVADDTLKSINSLVDESIVTSDIACFNALERGKIEVNSLTYLLMQWAKDVYNLTSGAYNPCVYYLVDLWGFSPRFNDYTPVKPYDREYKTSQSGRYLPLPDEEYIDGFARLSDFDNVILSNTDGKFYLEKKEGNEVVINNVAYYTKVDLGGLIKGYAVDRLSVICDGLGIQKGYISYGSSSLRLMTNKKGENYTLSLTNPRTEEVATDKGEFTDVTVSKDMANINISSSGDYERYYYVDNVRYSHIIDGKSGRPINNGMVAATIIGGSAVYADMLSTAICVMGKEKAIEFLTGDYCQNNGIRGCFTYFDGKYTVYSTEKGWKVVNNGFDVVYL